MLHEPESRNSMHPERFRDSATAPSPKSLAVTEPLSWEPCSELGATLGELTDAPRALSGFGLDASRANSGGSLVSPLSPDLFMPQVRHNARLSTRVRPPHPSSPSIPPRCWHRPSFSRSDWSNASYCFPHTSSPPDEVNRSASRSRLSSSSLAAAPQPRTFVCPLSRSTDSDIHSLSQSPSAA